MKALIFTDNHFCESSSIIRQFGSKYSLRLENQIASLNWLERLAEEKACDMVICAGDFFDKPTLTDAELTALREISWNGLPHYFLVGNHESSINGLRFNSTKALEADGRRIISDPTSMVVGNTEICFLPYIIESDRKQIKDYFGEKTGKRVIISHNDVLGLQMGPVQSKTGFATADFRVNADLTVNGHLHNGHKVSEGIVNLGNLTGQNFGEDAKRYKHNVMILDLETLGYVLIENPFAFNFYKIEIKNEKDMQKLSGLKANAVLSVSCSEGLASECRRVISEIPSIVASRLILVREATESVRFDRVDFSIDYISKFIECAKRAHGDGVIINEELVEICK